MEKAESWITLPSLMTNSVTNPDNNTIDPKSKFSFSSMPYFLHGLYEFTLTENLKLNAMGLFKFEVNTPVQFDVNGGYCIKILLVLV